MPTLPLELLRMIMSLCCRSDLPALACLEKSLQASAESILYRCIILNAPSPRDIPALRSILANPSRREYVRAFALNFPPYIEPLPVLFQLIQRVLDVADKLVSFFVTTVTSPESAAALLRSCRSKNVKYLVIAPLIPGPVLASWLAERPFVRVLVHSSTRTPANAAGVLAFPENALSELRVLRGHGSLLKFLVPGRPVTVVTLDYSASYNIDEQGARDYLSVMNGLSLSKGPLRMLNIHFRRAEDGHALAVNPFKAFLERCEYELPFVSVLNLHIADYWVHCDVLFEICQVLRCFSRLTTIQLTIHSGALLSYTHQLQDVVDTWLQYCPTLTRVILREHQEEGEEVSDADIGEEDSLAVHVFARDVDDGSRLVSKQVRKHLDPAPCVHIYDALVKGGWESGPSCFLLLKTELGLV